MTKLMMEPGYDISINDTLKNEINFHLVNDHYHLHTTLLYRIFMPSNIEANCNLSIPTCFVI